jgi:hypothetical protein
MEGILRHWIFYIGYSAVRFVRGSNIQIRDLEGIGLDEIPSGLHLVPHEGAEDLVCFHDIFHLHLQKRSLVSSGEAITSQFTVMDLPWWAWSVTLNS